MSTSDSRTVTFQELINENVLEIGDGYRAKNEELGGNGPLFLRAGHVTDTHIDFEGVERFHVTLTEKLKPKMARVGDTIVTTKGNSTGRTSYVTPAMPSFVYSPHLSYWRTRNETKVANGFLRYWSRSAEFTRQLSGMKTSTDMAPYLSLTDQRRLRITLLPGAEQQAIACILGVLDDKIELNRRRNRTLEAMARAIFQSWFVKFDPVKAKAAGRTPPGLSPALAALFPDRFEDSPLGPIPAGWRMEALSSLMTFEGGTQPPASQFISDPREGYVRLVQIRDFANDSHITFVPDTSKLRKFTTDDVMLARYGSSGNTEKSNDSLARVCRGLSGAYNVALVKVIPLRENREFLNFYLRSGSFQSVIKGMGARSVQSGFRKQDLDVIRVVSAPRQILDAFEQFGGQIWQCTFAADRESRTLASLRDALLPKLISGELGVPDAERIVARTT